MVVWHVIAARVLKALLLKRDHFPLRNIQTPFQVTVVIKGENEFAIQVSS